MPVQTPVPIRLPGSFPPNVPQPSGHNSSPLPPPADYYVSRKELLEIAPDLGVMKSVPSAANDTVVLFDDKGQVKSSGVKLSDKADTETVETLVGEDGGKSAREIAKEEVNQLLGEDPNELYDTFTEVSEFIDEAKQNYQAINNALSETAKSLSTKADKTALADEVARATQSEAQIDGKINTIVADDTGKSARTIAAEEVAKVVADAPADFDTLKEIAEYIESDKTGAAQMVTKIDANANAITAEAQRAQEAEAALREGKADKVANATSGNLASLDSNGNLADSGKAIGDFALAESLAPFFELRAYEVGDLCTSFDNDEQHKGTWLYKCILAPDPLQMPTPPEIDTTHWALATVEDVLAALRGTVDGKVDKVANATSGNLAALDANGNLADSGNMVAGAFTAESFIGGAGGRVGFQLSSTSEVVELYVNDGGGKILKFPLREGTLAVQDDIAPTFDETDTYDNGALVFHDGLYQCVNPNGHTGAWVAADFAEATVEDLLAALRTALAGKQDALFQEQVEAVNSGITANKVSKLEGIEAGAQKNPDLSGYATKSEIPYSLIEVPLADRINLTDRAVNKVTADGSLNYIQFVFPEKKEGKSRDFFLRLVITGETVPTLSFDEPNGGSVSFDVDDDSWADIEQGVNILMFTDTEA